jgi:hypothetical protein
MRPRIALGTCTHWLRARIVDWPCVIGLPINDELFSADVEHLLAPDAVPDEIVCWTTPAPTKDDARGVPCAPGARLGYGSHREGVARLNHLMRATWLRTADATWREVGALLDLVGPAA